MKTNEDLRGMPIKVYIGQDSGCRCGCNGQYIYRVDNPELVALLLEHAYTLFNKGFAHVDYVTTRLTNYVLPNDRALTFYYDE